MNELLRIHPQVQAALADRGAVVALESTITTHGLPRPDNLEAARMSEAAVREAGAVPATVAVRDGRLLIGLDDEELIALADARDIPKVSRQNLAGVLAGTGWGHTSPVEVTSNLVYAMVHLEPGQRIDLPDHAERCLYPLRGTVAIDAEPTTVDLLVVDHKARELLAATEAVVAILGGDPIGERHMWWNLVHSSKERLVEQAERWRNGDFPTIPGDAQERVEAPEQGP